MKKDKSNHLIFSVLTVVVAVLAFVFISNPESFVFAAAPSAPTKLIATPGDGEVSLSWTAPKDATPTGYYVKHNNPSTTINTKSTSTTYVVTGLTNGVEYTFSVAAYNKDGSSTYTTGVTATPLAASATVPDAPTLRTLTEGDGSLTAVWTAPGDDGGSSITGYEILYTPDGGVSSTSSVGNVTTATITGLTNGTEYVVRVRAQNAEGYSAYSNGLLGTPEASISAPNAPSLGALTPGNGTVQITWTAPGDDGGDSITDYTISYTPEDGSEQTQSVGGTSSPYTLSGLTNGTEYTIKIAAENSQGLGLYSSTDTATPFTTPGTPTAISLTPGDGTLGVSWTAPSSNGSTITDYTISYTKAGGSEQVVNVGSGATSFTLSDLDNGANYTVKVSAENSAGTGSYSSTFTSAPDESTEPALIGQPTITASDRSATIVWSTNKYTSTRVDFGLIDVTTSTSETNKENRVTNHTVVVSSLVPCTAYSYKVYSKDALNQTVTSSKQTFTTSGCEGESTVKTIQRDTVDTTVGGSLDFTSSDVKTKLIIPSNLKTGETNVVFQAKLLDKTEVESDINTPEPQKRWLGDHVYKLSAYASETEEIENFDNPVEVTIQYTRSDIEGINLNTLSMYHYEADSGWLLLTDCENIYNSSTGIGELTCSTSGFSIFGLFGDPAENYSSSGNYISTINTDSSTDSSYDENEYTLDQDLETEITLGDENVDVAENDTQVERIHFTQDLWWGNNNSDVFKLQKFLNLNGFILAQDGPGSPGRETSYFGPRTFDAVKAFQMMYADSILKPAGLAYPSGYFGYFTRNYINQNF